MNIFTAEELSEILKISPRKSKELIKTEGFPSIKIGQSYRVEEEALLEWLRSTKSIELNYNKK